MGMWDHAAVLTGRTDGRTRDVSEIGYIDSHRPTSYNFHEPIWLLCSKAWLVDIRSAGTVRRRSQQRRHCQQLSRYLCGERVSLRQAVQVPAARLHPAVPRLDTPRLHTPGSKNGLRERLISDTLWPVRMYMLIKKKLSTIFIHRIYPIFLTRFKIFCINNL